LQWSVHQPTNGSVSKLSKAVADGSDLELLDRAHEKKKMLSTDGRVLVRISSRESVSPLVRVLRLEEEED